MNSYSIDATMDDGTVGRLINHSRRGNIVPKCTGIDGSPTLYFSAKRDIAEGEEIVYDYGERDPETVVTFPWLKN